MMGLSETEEGDSGAGDIVRAKQMATTKKLMDDLDKQYEVCRLITHRDQYKGLGLGFGLGAAMATNNEKLPGQ